MTWSKTSAAAKAVSDSWWTILVMAILVGGIVYQRWEFTHPAKRVFAKAGDTIPSLSLETPTKQKVLLNWSADEKPTIVYVFTPTCQWCKRNLAAMRTLASSTPAYHFVAVSLVKDGVSDYVSTNHLTMPVYIAADKASQSKLAIRGTPTTLVVSSKGVISEAWPGVYHGKTAQEVEKTFNVRLPDVAVN